MSGKNLKRLAKLDTNEEACNLKFSSCDDNKLQLWKLNKSEIKDFIAFAKKIENIKWNDIQKLKGLHYETISNLRLPDNISKDITLKSIRVTQKFRIYGYRMGSEFYIIWFDPNHELT